MLYFSLLQFRLNPWIEIFVVCFKIIFCCSEHYFTARSHAWLHLCMTFILLLLKRLGCFSIIYIFLSIVTTELQMGFLQIGFKLGSISFLGNKWIPVKWLKQAVICDPLYWFELFFYRSILIIVKFKVMFLYFVTKFVNFLFFFCLFFCSKRGRLISWLIFTLFVLAMESKCNASMLCIKTTLLSRLSLLYSIPIALYLVYTLVEICYVFLSYMVVLGNLEIFSFEILRELIRINPFRFFNG